jgi:hypothetical protein
MLKNPKDSTKTLLVLINNFGNAEGYVINIQKSVYFQHINDQQSGKAIKKKLPFTTASRIPKILSYKFNQNYKTLKKEIEEDTKI